MERLATSLLRLRKHRSSKDPTQPYARPKVATGVDNTYPTLSTLVASARAVIKPT